jgi:hypothetical protein
MAIALSTTTRTGDTVTYGRITGLEMDYQTKETQAFIGGYADRDARLRGEKPATVMIGTFTMPEPIPQDLVLYAYQRLAEANPDIDFTEV